MSYARLARQAGQDSDVYVFMHYVGWLECHWCRIAYEDGTYRDGFPGSDCYRALSTADMTAHLREHIARGHSVPDYVIPDIEADDAENFPAKRTPRS